MVKIKEEKGFAVADALVAILIISLFTGLIATLSYNLYITSAGTKRSVEADTYIIDFFEHVDASNFNNSTDEEITDDLLEYINESLDDKISATDDNEQINNLTTPYKAYISVVDYVPEGYTAGNLVKIITLELQYNIGRTIKHNTIQHVKTNDI